MSVSRAIDACPDILTRTLEALSAKTGWSFSVLLSGPDPRGDGNISTMRYALVLLRLTRHTDIF